MAIWDALGAIFPGVSNVFGSILGTSSTSSTNATNLQIAKENNALQQYMFNEANRFNAVEAEKARQFNSLQSALDRDFQAEQAQINRDFESIDSQVKRAMVAGVNPSAIISGAMGSSPVQPSSNAASGSAASASGLPHLVTPTMENNVAALAPLANIGLQMAQARNLNADTEKKESETEGQNIQNSRMPDIIQSQLDINKETARQLSTKVDEINANIQVLKTTVDDLQSQMRLRTVQGSLIDRERIGKELENFFAGDRYRAIIRNFNASSYKQEQEVDQAWKRLTIEQAIGNAQIANFSALNKYYGALVEKVGYENKYYQGMTNLLHWQSMRERQQYLFDSIWTPQERRAGLEEQKYRIKQFDYQTDTWYRFTQGWKDILSPVGSIIGGAAGAYVGVKGLKMKTPNGVKTIPQVSAPLPGVPFN